MRNLSTQIIRSALFTALVAGSLAAIATPASANAQSQDRLRFKAPFAFEYGSTRLPAGVYTVHTQTPFTLIGGTAANSSSITRLEWNGMSEKGKIVFHKYGNRYFLSEVWMPGKSSHLVCSRTKAEKQAATAAKNTVALKEPLVSNVELAALEMPR
jgi:TRAP-type mannitol/chloroaromatic compound transport system substrate-binding protein